MSIGRKKEKDKPKKSWSYIELQGAYNNGEDASPQYTPRSMLAIHPTKITFFTDHLVVANQYRLVVMETYEEIKAKIKGEG